MSDKSPLVDKQHLRNCLEVTMTATVAATEAILQDSKTPYSVSKHLILVEKATEKPGRPQPMLFELRPY